MLQLVKSEKVTYIFVNKLCLHSLFTADPQLSSPLDINLPYADSEMATGSATAEPEVSVNPLGDRTTADAEAVAVAGTNESNAKNNRYLSCSFNIDGMDCL